YVIGDPLCGAGMYTAPSSLPFALSYARSMAPRCPLGVVKKPPSPAINSVLVTSTPIRPGRPVRGIFNPLSAGWLRTMSGVSPCAICQTCSPLLRSVAVMRPHGGFTSGSPWTDRPPPPSSPPATAGAGPPKDGGAAGLGGAAGFGAV